ncbi:MAG: HAD family phosphatase [Treponema sp.]|jgi:putative hydrolase of the HAD superfamily|nr:HAD family phosphatase [Treponema sp.]
MEIKAVAFDYGGVISYPQDGEAMKDMAEMAGIDASLMNQIYWDNRSLYDQGQMDGKEYFKNILADVEVHADSNLLDKLIARDMESWSHINPKTEALIQEIKNSGIKTAILSNMVKDFLDRVMETLPVYKLFDTGVFSCNVDAVKPEEIIYHILLSQLDCKAEELVYFDDVEENINAARAIGIQAFLWKDPEAAHDELKSLKVL